ncbi:MAG: hypothetical protein ACTMIA_06160 [Vibrio sp.]
MAKKVNLVMFIVVISLVVFVLLDQATKIEDKAEKTAFTLAVSQMWQRSIRIKQRWLLAQKPAFIDLEHRRVLLDAQGWPKVQGSQNEWCNTLLAILYPQRSIANFSPMISTSDVSSHYTCRYRYTDVYQVQISLDQHGLAIFMIDLHAHQS